MPRVFVFGLDVVPDMAGGMLTYVVDGKLRAIPVELWGPPDPNVRRRLGPGTKHYRIVALAAAALEGGEPQRPTEILDLVEERADPFDREHRPRRIRLNRLSVMLWNEARLSGRRVESDGRGLYRAA